jgi:hypothetical protein
LILPLLLTGKSQLFLTPVDDPEDKIEACDPGISSLLPSVEP